MSSRAAFPFLGHCRADGFGVESVSLGNSEEKPLATSDKLCDNTSWSGFGHYRNKSNGPVRVGFVSEDLSRLCFGKPYALPVINGQCLHTGKFPPLKACFKSFVRSNGALISTGRRRASHGGVGGGRVDRGSRRPHLGDDRGAPYGDSACAWETKGLRAAREIYRNWKLRSRQIERNSIAPQSR